MDVGVCARVYAMKRKNLTLTEEWSNTITGDKQLLLRGESYSTPRSSLDVQEGLTSGIVVKLPSIRLRSLVSFRARMPLSDTESVVLLNAC